MKQSNTFKLNEESENYARKTTMTNYPDKWSPSKQTINNVMNYAKALEVTKSQSGPVYFSIIN